MYVTPLTEKLETNKFIESRFCSCIPTYRSHVPLTGNILFQKICIVIMVWEDVDLIYGMFSAYYIYNHSQNI